MFIIVDVMSSTPTAIYSLADKMYIHHFETTNSNTLFNSSTTEIQIFSYIAADHILKTLLSKEILLNFFDNYVF